MSGHERSSGRHQLVEQLLAHVQREASDRRLRDLAGDVLSGRISLSEAVTSRAYAEALAPAMTNYGTWYSTLGPDERDEHFRQGETLVQRLEELATDSDHR